VNTLVICSGGLDSVTLAYQVAASANLNSLISFNYGQRHAKELEFAAQCANSLGVEHMIIDLRALGQLLTGSALTDTNTPMPHGHYAEQNMQLTIVPNRNPVMMSIAFAVAASRELDAVALAVHGGDHFIYPDCRPDFLQQFAKMQAQALDGIASPELQAPYQNYRKSDIVLAGAKHAVPFAQTWSCYEGGDVHCGRCGTCVERQEAFHNASITDPTIYKDTSFWQQTIASHKGQ
jgi:7-cyano-7-deazaguanine synthase